MPAHNIGVQGTSVRAPTSAQYQQHRLLSAAVAMYASNGGITQNSNGVISAATHRLRAGSPDRRRYASRQRQPDSIGAQTGGAITTARTEAVVAALITPLEFCVMPPLLAYIARQR